MDRPKERVRLAFERILRPRGVEEKDQKAGRQRQEIWTTPASYRFARDPAGGSGCFFLSVGREHPRCGCVSLKPARNRLDSRTRVRNPSITGGIGS